jgi:hypothetical protein
MIRQFLIVCGWVAVLAAGWLTVASCAFLWFAGLWDNPLIPSWSRPWQWLVYARHGDGSFSEDLYLIVAAIAASAPGVFYVRFTDYIGTRVRQSLYGQSGFASTDDMKNRGIVFKKEPFDL